MSTKILNDDPGWRAPCVARLYRYRSKPGPPTIARTAPVCGVTATIAAVNCPPVSGRTLFRAERARNWASGLNVVSMRRPPLNRAL